MTRLLLLSGTRIPQPVNAALLVVSRELILLRAGSIRFAHLVDLVRSIDLPFANSGGGGDGGDGDSSDGSGRETRATKVDRGRIRERIRTQYTDSVHSRSCGGRVVCASIVRLVIPFFFEVTL